MDRKKRKCNDAISKAYKSLREKKLPDDWTAGVGTAIYQFHYPTASRNVATERAISLLKKESSN